MLEPPPELLNRKFMLCASTGGHLWQLERIARRLQVTDDSLWVTFDTAQSRALLAGRRVLYVPYISPRDVRGMLKAAVQIDRALRRETFDALVSTGAGIAVSSIVATPRRAMRRLYIESVSRVTGPSLSGRIVYATRLYETWAQHPGWATGRWQFHGSVLDNRCAQAGTRTDLRRVFVTMGTIKPYQFTRLVERLMTILPADVDVVWQLGATKPVASMTGDVHAYMSPEEFAAQTHRADVVVTHSGVGSVIGLIEDGIFPVVIPRRARHGEHVDDHQQEIARFVQELGVGLVREADELSLDDLVTATAMEVTRAPQSG